MTLTGPDTHTIRSDTSQILRDGFEIMQIVGIDALLARLSQKDGHDTAKLACTDYRLLPQRGYHLAGIGATALELWVSGQTVTVKAILDALWFDYDDKQLASIGFSHLRTPERAAAMRNLAASSAVPEPATAVESLNSEDKPDPTGPQQQGSTRSPTAGERRRAWNVYRAEYQQLIDHIHKALAPIDDTPVTSNHRTADRPTVKAVAAAANRPAIKEIRARKMEVLNEMVAAGLMVENRKRHGNYDVLSGILADDRGHRAGDETHLATSLARDISTDTAPGHYMARKHGHNRRYKGAPALVGLDALTTVAGPDDAHDIPTLCVGFDFHHPTGGYGPGIVNALRHAEHNGLRPTIRSNEVQMFIGDGAYHDAKGLLEALNTSGYGRVVKPSKDRNLLYEIGGTANPDGTATQGLPMFHGRLLSPGIGIDFLRSIDHIRDTPSEQNHDEIRLHAVLDARLMAALLPTNGRPTVGPDRTRGGQTKHTLKNPPNAAHVSVACPMVRNLGRCHLFEEFDDPDYAHLIPLTGSPDDLDPRQRPAVCTNSSGQMRAKIPLGAFATWQEHMPGTFAWTDWYTGPRAANERWNSFLKSRFGPDMTLGAIPARRAGLWSLLATLAIVAANRRSLEGWENRIMLNGGRIPAPPARAVRAHRALVIAQTGVTYLATSGGSGVSSGPPTDSPNSNTTEL